MSFLIKIPPKNVLTLICNAILFIYRQNDRSSIWTRFNEEKLEKSIVSFLPD
ncbi:hypothetical protein H1P_5850001 [Hyella patelloides LEGE 07179]|uniref:Uncharacterized protein n=1 Tax=Hyella patelloides LEGE 07179 TaxID=945734 RepID=A0A563W0S6_9CYAN|nr:hypothetical protein H1P_5850001 [Hyella patelloides LEGE 07179]